MNIKTKLLNILFSKGYRGLCQGQCNFSPGAGNFAHVPVRAGNAGCQPDGTARQMQPGGRKKATPHDGKRANAAKAAQTGAKSSIMTIGLQFLYITFVNYAVRNTKFIIYGNHRQSQFFIRRAALLRR
ncbi:MAG TPA: hypothetical protein IAA99_04815 [Candidatus Avibacteroides faecavium]|nr:hypothetical protein [Candidatus Avibacteroides faecavium]